MDIGYGCSVLSFALAELFPYAITAWIGYLGLRVVRAVERRGLPPAEHHEALADRVRRIEEAVEDAVEAQRFTTRLLLRRTTGGEEPLSAASPWPSSRPASSFDPGPNI